MTEKLTTTTKITTASQITTTKISTTLVTTSTHHIEYSQEKINENITQKADIKNSNSTSSDFSFDIPGYVYRIGSKIGAIMF